VIQGGKLKAQARMQGGEQQAAITVAALAALQQVTLHSFQEYQRSNQACTSNCRTHRPITW
jgi:hypothetical protein